MRNENLSLVQTDAVRQARWRTVGIDSPEGRALRREARLDEIDGLAERLLIAGYPSDISVKDAFMLAEAFIDERDRRRGRDHG